MRPKGLGRKTGMNVVPIMVYVTVAVVFAAGMYLWDVQYRRAEEAKRRPPEPEVIARNLVENIVGANTVTEVKIDREKKTVAIAFTSVLFKPEKPKKDLRELLEAEATLATKAILLQMREYVSVKATLLHEGKTLAIAEASRDQDKISMTFVDERLKE